MYTPLSATPTDSISDATTRYCPVVGHGAMESTEANVQQICSPAGQMVGGILKLSGAPGSGKSVTAVLRVNGSNTAISVVVTHPATTASFFTTPVSISAGDLVSWSITGTASMSSVRARVTCYFSGTTAKECPVMSLQNVQADATTPRYFGISGFVPSGNGDGTEAGQWNVFSPPGVLKNFRMRLTSDPGVARVRTFTVYQNGSPTAMTVTFTSGVTIASDLVNTISVSAGDRISVREDVTNIPNAAKAAMGFVFEATTDGDAPGFTGLSNTPSTSSTNYSPAWNNNGGGWDSSETYFDVAGVYTVKNLYGYLNTAPTSGKSFTWTFRNNSSNQSLAITIADAAVSANSSNSFTTALYDNLSISSVPSGSPATLRVSLGFTINATIPVTFTPQSFFFG